MVVQPQTCHHSSGQALEENGFCCLALPVSTSWCQCTNLHCSNGSCVVHGKMLPGQCCQWQRKDGAAPAMSSKQTAFFDQQGTTNMHERLRNELKKFLKLSPMSCTSKNGTLRHAIVRACRQRLPSMPMTKRLQISRPGSGMSCVGTQAALANLL